MKRVLLIVAIIIGLILAGSILANNSVAPRLNQVVPGLERYLRGQRSQPARAIRHYIDPCQAVVAPPAHVPTLTARPGRYLLVDPPTAAPGSGVAVHGGGFASRVALRLSLRVPGMATVTQTKVKARKDGSFCTIFVMPASQTVPSAALVAQDALGHSATATVALSGALPLAGLAPAVVIPGQRAAVWAVNFRSGETVHVYSTRLAGHPLVTVKADRAGHGYWPLAVPYGPAGINQVVVVGDAGRVPVVAHYLLLSLYPHAGVSNYAPQPGKRVTFYGGGFGPHEPVELHLNRLEGPVLAVARTNANGGLRRLGPYQLPFGLSGARTFILHGIDSHVTTTVDVLMLPFNANVRPSTYAAGPGTTLTFYGGGFAPREIVRVYLARTAGNTGNEVAALRTTATGQLIASSGSYNLPATANATALTFSLVGDISGAVASTTVHYLPPGPGILVSGQSDTYHPPPRQHAATVSVRVPVLFATPPSVEPGGRVALSGTGFPPATAMRLVLGSNDTSQGWTLVTVLTGYDGTLNTTVTIPRWVPRADVVRAVSGAGIASPTIARAELEVRPTVPLLTSSVPSAPAGTAYSLSGTGFTPGEQVSLYFDNIATSPLATTTSSGRFAFEGLRVPVAADGNHTFVVKGAYGDIASVSFTQWSMTPFLLLSTYSTLPEHQVSVSGQGFVPGEPVHLFLSGTLMDEAHADDRGGLHVMDAFTIPSNVQGSLQVAAVGAMSERPARTALDVRPFEASLWLSSYAGHPGATVSFTGKGFARDDTLNVYVGNAPAPAARFQAHSGAFTGAGAVHIPFGARAGFIQLTVRGVPSGVWIPMRYRVIPFAPGAGYEIRRHGAFTVLRLGAGGFAPHEQVRLYRGTDTTGRPLRLLSADGYGDVPPLRVLMVRGTPRNRLEYTLVGVQSGARATALYTPRAIRQSSRKAGQ